ncbi:MAG: hypothetical protein ACOX0H_01020 [Patescibacteria group bacterium]|jgi:hypothetical protein|nr:hypothetical protein [bacterium]HQC49559.1 hypothetical protein [bacterium]
MAKKRITWFIEPLSAHTNEVIFKNFFPIDEVSDIMRLSDNEGVFRMVYQVSKYAIITNLNRDRRKFNLQYNVYYRESKYGKLKLWKFNK